MFVLFYPVSKPNFRKNRMCKGCETGLVAKIVRIVVKHFNDIGTRYKKAGDQAVCAKVDEGSELDFEQRRDLPGEAHPRHCSECLADKTADWKPFTVAPGMQDKYSFW